MRGMNTTAMFEGMDVTESNESPGRVEADFHSPPRLRRPDRRQMVWEACCLDERLPADHAVRTIEAVVRRMDLSGFYAAIDARGEAPGRAATDPRLLIALWLYAATEGIGNGRRLARLCEAHDAYRWPRRRRTSRR